ncbi:MAG: ferrous iron transport protein B [Saprospiraceae bacterium]|nr:ferrous iron transport protein B [Saprospiraceae bacterium]
MKEGATIPPKIALIGNPNSGKSTIFNQLTGLRQKTGNFPGVTVDIKEGHFKCSDGSEVMLIDFPGTYSFYPSSSDEKLVSAVLANPKDPRFPDAIVYIADVTCLEKHLLLLTQLLDLQLPILMALNMADTASELGIKINVVKLSEELGIPVVLVSGRTGEQMPKLTTELEKLLLPNQNTRKPFYDLNPVEKQVSEAIRLNFNEENPYRALQLAHHFSWLPFLNEAEKATIATIVDTKNFQSLRYQVDETLDRFDRFTPLVHRTILQPPAVAKTPTDRIDAVFTHRWAGPVLFFATMLLLFQAIFEWSVYPMDWIESGFSTLNEFLQTSLPAHWTTELLTDGILTGLAGILVFVPQIALLFLLITILEEVGYMARVVFMFDRTMRRFGMNGRSVVALIGGSACAVPAIMSSRTIGNWKERLITVMVTPFISCSARIPVYLVLIGLAVPKVKIGGFLSAQTLVFGAMYALGVIAAFLTGYAMKRWLRTREPSFLAIELPVYRVPYWKNVWLTVWEKVSAFVVGAGKIILIVSIALWALSRFGPGDAMATATADAEKEAAALNLDAIHQEDLIKQRQLEASWAGQMGKAIEPAIRPLGYDWKIGIALLTSFAAREVFTGTLAVLYNMGSAEADINDRSDNEAKATMRQKMQRETFRDSGKPVYSLATALSLLVFYALAMQCMSTLAVVSRETGSWKWAFFQFLFMSGLAYLAAWLVQVVFA